MNHARTTATLKRSVPPSARKPTILVLDGEHRASLAVTRSLGRSGYRVIVGASTDRSLAGGSRFAEVELRLPDPKAGGLRFAEAVGQAAEHAHAMVVLPMTEASALALLEHPAELRGAILPMGGLQQFRLATDKLHLVERAARIGIPVPNQWTLDGPLADAVPAQAARYPVVVKPARSVVGTDGARHQVAVGYASDIEELRRVVHDLGQEAGPFLIQERVVGPGIGVFLLRWRGRVLASFAHQRIREKPPSGGVSTCCQSIPVPRQLLEQSIALLEDVGWNGVAMIEFKRHDATGLHYLMEINPRFWGSLQLAIDAGVDFPNYLVAAALGEEVAAVHDWQIGLRSRWVLGDFDHLIARLRRSSRELALPPGTPGRIQAAASVLLPLRPHQRNDVLRFGDPVPALREFVQWVRDLW